MNSVTIISAATAIKNFDELRERARKLGPKRVGVVVADDDVALLAAAGAAELGLAIPVLIGDEAKIRAKIRDMDLMALISEAMFVGAADS